MRTDSVERSGFWLYVVAIALLLVVLVDWDKSIPRECFYPKDGHSWCIMKDGSFRLAPSNHFRVKQ